MSTPTGSILAIDFGLRRCGIARSDPERLLATGLPTFEMKPGRSIRRHLDAIARDTPFAGLVLGLPRRGDGRLGGPIEEIRKLGVWIATHLGVPIAYWDESYSSVKATDLLRSAPKRVRRDKGKTDEFAARILLQEFLDAGCPFAEHPFPESEFAASQRGDSEESVGEDQK